MPENCDLRKIFGLKRDEAKGAGRNCITRNLMIRNLAKYYPGDQVKKSEMGGQVVLTGKRGVG